MQVGPIRDALRRRFQHRALDVSVFKQKSPQFGVIYTGFFRVNADGDYGFSTQSSNGSVLLIDDQIVVEMTANIVYMSREALYPCKKAFIN